jgi:hypothetical protein
MLMHPHKHTNTLTHTHTHLNTHSHQNIFTIGLIEGLDISGLKTTLLPLKAFPSGVKFNHDKPYMKAIQDRHETPFMFHMCWTRNKV